MSENAGSSDERQSVWKRKLREELERRAGLNIFDYHEQRKKGLIPQCEDPGWGYDRPKHREQTRTMYNTYVTQSFFELDWNKSFTGRGVYPASDRVFGTPVLVGPKGVSLEEVADHEPPTAPELRALWAVVDKGEDDVIDPLYRICRESSSHGDDKDSVGDDDEDVGPFGGRRDDELGPFDEPKYEVDISPYNKPQHQAQPETIGDFQHTLQVIASQGCKTLGDDTCPIALSHQQAELGPSGEMRKALAEMLGEGSQSQREHSGTTQDAISCKPSEEEATQCSKKRRRNPFKGSASGLSGNDAEFITHISGPNQKRIRLSQIKPKPNGEVKSVIDEDYDDFADDETEGGGSPSRWKKLGNSQAAKKAVSHVLKDVLTGVNIRGPQKKQSKSAVIGAAGDHVEREKQGDEWSQAKAQIIPTTTESKKSERKEGLALQSQYPEDHDSDSLSRSIANSQTNELVRKTPDRSMDTKKTRGHPVSSKSRGTKRRRASSDDEFLPNALIGNEDSITPKRARLECSESDDGMNMSDGDSGVEDSLFDDREASQEGLEEDSRAPFRPIFRPTFFGIAKRWDKKIKNHVFVPDNNEVGDVVVTGMRKIEPGSYESTFGSSSRIDPGPRSWTADEEETLRSWVQDYGIQKWDSVAWCLRRTVKDCQEQYQEIVMIRNKLAGRDIYAGLPGWGDPELELTAEEIAMGAAEQAAAREANKEKKAAAREAKAAEESEKSAADEVPAANQELDPAGQPGESVPSQSKPHTWLGVGGSELHIRSDMMISRDRGGPSTLRPSADTDPQVESAGPLASRLRARKPPSNNKLGIIGLIRYDPKAKAFPKVTIGGAVVDPKGELMLTFGREAGSSRGQAVERAVKKEQQESSRSCGEKGETREKEESDLGSVEDLEGYGNGRKDKKFGRDAGIAVRRYCHRWDSPSFAGSLVGTVIHGHVVKRSSGVARRGIERKAGRGRK